MHYFLNPLNLVVRTHLDRQVQQQLVGVPLRAPPDVHPRPHQQLDRPLHRARVKGTGEVDEAAEQLPVARVLRRPGARQPVGCGAFVCGGLWGLMMEGRLSRCRGRGL